jgi:hypothetical protein
MANAMKRATYSGLWNGVAAFTVGAGKTWIVENLTYQITTVTTATSLDIDHRSSTPAVIARLLNDTGMATDAEAVIVPKFKGAVLEATDDIYISGGAASGEVVDIVLDYIEIS